MVALWKDMLADRLLPHLLTVGGFLLALFLVARLMSEKRQPSNTLAWLLAVTLMPYVGVPLYLLIGGRKLRRMVQRKTQISPSLPGVPPSPAADYATARTLSLNGVCPPVGGNSMRFISRGEDAFAEFEKQICEARHSIHIMTFILGRDEVGRRLVQLLAERARAGVKVRLLLDAVGCLFSGRGFCNPLREAGGQVERFMPVLPLQSRSSANLRNHRKIAVFDHRVAILGGHNLAREYMGRRPYRKRWRDFGTVIEGPAVDLFNEIFLADWVYASRQSVDALRGEYGPEPLATAGSAELQVVASGPDVAGDPLYEAMISLIQEANHSIWIVSPYFIPDEVLFRSLLVKARSGTDVKIVIPTHSNHPVTDLARRYYLRELDRAGVDIRLFSHGMMHCKGMIIDGRIGLMGSANFDLRSLFVNFEVGLLIYTPDEVAAMTAWARDLMTHCRPYAKEEKKPGWLSSAAEDLTRLIAPLL